MAVRACAGPDKMWGAERAPRERVPLRSLFGCAAAADGAGRRVAAPMTDADAAEHNSAPFHQGLKTPSRGCTS